MSMTCGYYLKDYCKYNFLTNDISYAAIIILILLSYGQTM